MSKWRFHEVEHTSTRRSTAFVDKRCSACDGYGSPAGGGPRGRGPCAECDGTGIVGGMVIREVPVYPDEEDRQELRERRVALNLSLRACADYFGLSVVDWSRVERGNLRPSNWCRLIEALDEVPRG